MSPVQYSSWFGSAGFLGGGGGGGGGGGASPLGGGVGKEILEGKWGGGVFVSLLWFPQ